METLAHYWHLIVQGSGEFIRWVSQFFGWQMELVIIGLWVLGIYALIMLITIPLQRWSQKKLL